MLTLLASAIALSAPQPATPRVQARASVRIVAGAQLHMDGRPNRHAPRARPAMIEMQRGQAKIPAQLIEFE